MHFRLIHSVKGVIQMSYHSYVTRWVSFVNVVASHKIFVTTTVSDRFRVFKRLVASTWAFLKKTLKQEFLGPLRSPKVHQRIQLVLEHPINWSKRPLKCTVTSKTASESPPISAKKGRKSDKEEESRKWPGKSSNGWPQLWPDRTNPLFLATFS
jgi:hypothetical protein